MNGTNNLNSKICLQIDLVSLVTKKAVQRKMLGEGLKIFVIFIKVLFFSKKSMRGISRNKPANE